MKSFCAAFIALLLFSFPSVADEWHVYSNMNDINSLAREGDTLWWTTRTGIVEWNRVDGAYHVFESSLWFTSVSIDPDSSKWFGTQGGEWVRFDGKTWTKYKDLPRSPTFAVDKNGVQWFTSNKGAMKFDGLTWTHLAPEGYASGNQEIPYYILYSDYATMGVVVDRNNIVWCGTNGAGLWSYDGFAWKVYRKNSGGLSSDVISSLALDGKGILWLCAGGILNSFDGVAWKNYPLGKDIPPLSIRGIVIDPHGVKWFGSDRGLISFDGAAWKLYDSSNSGIPVGYPAVRTLIADEKGVIWLSTGSQGEYTDKTGLTSFDGTTWKTITLPGISGNVVNSIGVDKNNVKWFATANEYSLSSFDGTSWKKYTDGLLTQVGNSIMVDSKNRKWFCTFQGISCLDGAQWKNYTAADGLPGGVIYKAAEDREGILWFCTDQGPCSFNGSQWTSYNETIKSMGIEGFGILTVDNNNVKWFGSPHYGVLSFDGKTWRHFTKADGLSGDGVRSIAVDKNNIVWVGTGILGNDAGVSSFDGSVWKAWSYSNGNMPVWGAVTGIAVDRANVKWIVSETDSAVFSYDGTSWKTYPSTESGSGYLSIAIDSDGVKWLGSKKMGAVSFRESEIIPTAVSNQNTLPKMSEITGIYPNPFNPSTTIEFTLSLPGEIRLVVYDSMGRIVRELVSGEKSMGKHSVLWDGRDDSGKVVSSGVYISRLQMGDKVALGRMLLLK